MQDRDILASKLKLGKLILRKIIKIVATRCNILKLKYIKFDFGWGSVPGPAAGSLQRSPDPVARFKGPTSKGGRQWREWEGEEGKGRKRKGKGRQG